ncbi:MAG TPA: YhjD/YihY/BrkB family envelope integrity protein, partial [Sphingomonas sp.]|uniref:YihY/virulence factor BrkB family protein n=1 Tax=Sphingomonas sp. TaxID=28214 RepID=UPI002EDAA100
YVANFGNYDATYGSLGAVVVLLTWIWLSAYVLLLGAELNSELEHQTARDTTRGPETPLGTRGAAVADTVAESPTQQADAARARAAAKPPARASRGGGSGTALILSGAGGRAARLAGGRRQGMVPSLLVAGGLSLLRRQKRAGLGAAMLIIGGGMAWLGRDRT